MGEPVKETFKMIYFNVSFSTEIFSATSLTTELFSLFLNNVTAC